MADSATLLAERRSAARIDASFAVSLHRPGGEPVTGKVVNISVTGVLVQVDEILAIWSIVTITLPGGDPHDARVVRRDGDRYGCLFSTPLDDVEFDAVLGSPEALTGLERLRLALDAPVPRRGMLRRLKR